MSGKSYPQDILEVLDYGFDLTRELAKTSDAIQSSVWSVDGDDEELVLSGDADDGDVTVVWISVGTLHTTYTVKNVVVTSGGRTYVMYLFIHIDDSVA